MAFLAEGTDVVRAALEAWPYYSEYATGSNDPPPYSTFAPKEHEIQQDSQLTDKAKNPMSDAHAEAHAIALELLKPLEAYNTWYAKRTTDAGVRHAGVRHGGPILAEEMVHLLQRAGDVAGSAARDEMRMWVCYSQECERAAKSLDHGVWKRRYRQLATDMKVDHDLRVDAVLKHRVQVKNAIAHWTAVAARDASVSADAAAVNRADFADHTHG